MPTARSTAPAAARVARGALADVRVRARIGELPAHRHAGARRTRPDRRRAGARTPDRDRARDEGGQHRPIQAQGRRRAPPARLGRCGFGRAFRRAGRRRRVHGAHPAADRRARTRLDRPLARQWSRASTTSRKPRRPAKAACSSTSRPRDMPELGKWFGAKLNRNLALPDLTAQGLRAAGRAHAGRRRQARGAASLQERRERGRRPRHRFLRTARADSRAPTCARA